MTSIRKKYKIIYADPPWSYKVWSEDKKGAQGCAKKHYNTMSIDDICAIPVNEMCDNDAKLFLWATPPCLPEAFKLISAWGFEYKTVAFAWVKLNKNSKPDQFSFLPYDSIDRFYGIGHWTASNIELVLGCLRPGGKLERQAKDISQIILSPLTRHSEKPKEVRDKIVRLCGDVPRLEMFCRGSAPGWDVFGNEAENSIQIEERGLGLRTTNARPGQGQAPSPKPCADCSYYDLPMSACMYSCKHRCGNRDMFVMRTASAIA